ncbi:Gfo/Idh/MocA family protein [Paenibacillus thalictri]|uniref:Gfo/Idh/MocA family oxidoreductase n=1 Tax=Paenibacillus thalictri TaxID=2527873 RepID=A0A4Q9DMW8_9BACL|nr:Gfo/Idh/MocA family oxidoreductase [Paenibacillus thalictri]TBL73266.1 Gfo/Idh/MocA family oxidoreductase [Paenibacillus thalictri]
MCKRYNVAVIGAGDMGARHVKGWIEAGHHVMILVDMDEQRLRKVAEENNVPYTATDYKEAVSRPEVDIVSICLPLAFHMPVTLYAAGQGKHIFCEKPLASSLEQAQQMEEAVHNAGVKFGLGFQRNLSPGIAVVKKWVEEDKFGRPLVISSDLLQEVRPKRVMHDKNGNQGPIVDTCCHYFLMWQTILQSKPRKVYASGGIFAKDRPEIAHFEQLAVDTAVITVEYESGDIGTMTISWALAKDTKMTNRNDRLFGPKGGVQGPFNIFTIPELELKLMEGDQSERVAIHQLNLHAEQFKLFAQALQDDSQEYISFSTGKEMMKLSYAVLESIETGKAVYVS